MSSSKAIYDINIFYEGAKPFVSFCFRQYYDTYTVEGLENLPKDRAFILAPNHQNALMDAIAILESKPGRTVFLARSDIFRNPVIATVLRFMKIMPVYRIRDGHDELNKNEQTFTKSTEVLQAGVTLCLMPEGRQSFRRVLLPLVKGMFRIAFQTQVQFGEKELFIIPVGIDYGDYVNEGGHFIIRFGMPISVKSFMDTYEQHPAQGLRDLQKEVAKGIGSLIQNIRSTQYYNEFYSISLKFGLDLCPAGRRAKALDLLKTRIVISEALDHAEQNRKDDLEYLITQYSDYTKALLANNISDCAVRSKPGLTKVFALLAILAISALPALFAWLVNAPATYLPRLVTSRFKDRTFVSSFAYGLYLIILLLIVLGTSLFAILGKLHFMVPLAFVVAPIFRPLLYFYRKKWKECWQALVFSILRLRNKPIVSQLIEKRESIKDILGEMSKSKE